MKYWKRSALIGIAVAVFPIGILTCGLLSMLNVFTNNRYETIFHFSIVGLVIYALVLQTLAMYLMNLEMSLRTRILAVILTLDIIILFIYGAIVNVYGGGPISHPIVSKVLLVCMRSLFIFGFLWVLSARKDTSNRQKNKIVADESTFNQNL